MRIAFFDTHRFEKPFFESANSKAGHEITYVEARLTAKTATLAEGYPAVCAFVNDRLDAPMLERLAKGGTKLVALRSAGFNHVDLATARGLGIRVVRVPEYSPHAVAEHAVALILTLNRQIHRAHARVRDGNFSLDGLVGFDLHQKTIGVVGMGRIGKVFARIMAGFGCRVLAYDLRPDPALERELGLRYCPLDRLIAESDVISLHLPLTPETRHLIDAEALARMKKGVMLINTGRGALIETGALIQALKTRHVGYAGLDVYEEEEGIFFEDLSGQVLQDDVLARLMTFPSVVLTSHQAFLTREALAAIAETTLSNVSDFEKGTLSNEVSFEANVKRSS